MQHDQIEKFWDDWLVMWSAYPYTEQLYRLDGLIFSCREQLISIELNGWSEVLDSEWDDEGEQ